MTIPPMPTAEVVRRLAPYEAFLSEPRNALLCIARGGEAGEAGGVGSPHATPVWFAYADGHFRVSITTGRVKYRLITANPAVTLVVDQSPGFRTVIAEGSATVSDDGAELVSLRRALWAKYGGRADHESLSDAELLAGLREEQRVVVRLAPDRVLCWDGD